MSSGPDPRADDWKRLAIFRICTAFDLSRAHRLEVATVLLDRQIESFKELSPHEVDQLWFAFNGAMYIASLLSDVKAGVRV
jgi:hypothetical protein